MIILRKSVFCLILQLTIIQSVRGQINTSIIDFIRRHDSLKIAVLVQNSSGEILVRHNENQIFPAASIIKIPLLMALYDTYGTPSGKLELPEYKLKEGDKTGGAGHIQFLGQNTVISFQDLAKAMMAHSDNTATNIIIDVLGTTRINQWISTAGYHKTRLNRKMMDTDAISKGIQNLITASEANQFILKIYNMARNGDRKAAVMLGLLHQCDDKVVIPAGLPPDIAVAHKSGLLPGFRGDTGIIFLQKPMFVSIFVEGCSSESMAESIIAGLTKIIYTSFSKSSGS